jgi:hypothetical protein
VFPSALEEQKTMFLRKKYAISSITLLLAGVGVCSDSPSQEAPLDGSLNTRSDAIWNGQNDTGGPVNDAVVRLSSNGTCTGTLITSTLILTAAHCVNGWTGYSVNAPPGGVAVGGQVTVGVNLASPLAIQSESGQTEVTARSLQSTTVRQTTTALVGPLTPGNEARDLAILRVFPPVVAQAFARKPTFQAPPVPATSIVASETFTIVGWGQLPNQALPTIRQTLTQPYPLGLGGFDIGSLGRTWFFSTSSPYTGPAPGDSGGPLFWQSNPANPQIGVASLVGPPNGSAVWADITSTVAQAFINTSAADPARPGKWLGETDYVGPCDLANDPDCDRFYDTIPGTGERGGDNCPGVYNPAQLDNLDINGNGLSDDGPKLDQDGDGIPDYCDLFPTCGLTFTDADGDGVCDKLDLCPCSSIDQNPAFSDDKDGHCGACDPSALGAVLPNGQTCADSCKGWVPDQCPGVSDEYGNDNEDSERVWNARPLGNACDPVPVPDFVPRWKEVIGQTSSSGGSGTGNWFTTKNYVRASAIEHRLRGSFGAPDSPIPGQGQNVVVPNTYHRYCLDKSLDGVVDVSCKSDDNVADGFMDLGGNRNLEAIDTRWHRVSIQGLLTPGTDPFNQNPSLQNRNYTPTPSALVRSWFLVDDFNAWIPTSWGQTLGLDVPHVPSLANPNTWPGRFWTHSDAQAGLTSDIGTGFHRKTDGTPGEQLSNHYEPLNPVQLEETTIAWDIPMYQPAFAWSFCPACIKEIPPVENDDCPMCKGLLPGSLLDSVYEPQLIARMPAVQGFPFRFGVVLRDGSFVNVDERLGPNLKQALEDTSRVWAEQVEPLSHLGLGATLPTALALSPDGRVVSERVSFQGRRFLGQQDRGRLGVAGEPGESGEPGEAVAFTASSGSSLQDPGQNPGEREAFQPVYSRYLGRVFVVGGRDPANQAPRGDVWWQDAQGEAIWHRVPDQGYSVNRVLAATYSFRDDRLWILDEVKGPGGLKRARLVRLDPRTGEFEQIGQWLRLGLFNQHWLVVDKDGQVLLAASSDVARKHLVIRLDNRAPQVKPTAIRLGQGALAYRPMVDQEGYSFVKRQTKKNKPPTVTERSKTLGGIPAAWSHLNGCW